jgi:hypothetical protein
MHRWQAVGQDSAPLDHGWHLSDPSTRQMLACIELAEMLRAGPSTFHLSPITFHLLVPLCEISQFVSIRGPFFVLFAIFCGY